MDPEVGSSHQIVANNELGEPGIVRWTRKSTQHDIVNCIVGDQMVYCTLILHAHGLLDQSTIFESIRVRQRTSKFFLLFLAPFPRFMSD